MTVNRPGMSRLAEQMIEKCIFLWGKKVALLCEWNRMSAS